jgi:hypothetical protein
MPPESTVRTWALDDREGFSAQYARARDMQLETWADEVMEISDDARNDWMERQAKGDEAPSVQVNGEHIQRSKLRVDSRKWMLSKLKPEKYGERIKTEVTGKNGKDLIPDRPVENLEIARYLAFIWGSAALDIAEGKVPAPQKGEG